MSEDQTSASIAVDAPPSSAAHTDLAVSAVDSAEATAAVPSVSDVSPPPAASEGSAASPLEPHASPVAGPPPPVLETVVRVDELPEQVTAQQVLQYFSLCGPVSRLALVPMNERRPSTTAFLQFREPSSVTVAEMLSETSFEGRGIFVYKFYNVRSLEEAVAVARRNSARRQSNEQLQLQNAGWFTRASAAITDLIHKNIMTEETARDIKAGMVTRSLSLSVSAQRALNTGSAAAAAGPARPEIREQYAYTAAQPQWGAKPAWTRSVS